MPHNSGNLETFKAIIATFVGIVSSSLLFYLRKFKWFTFSVIIELSMVWLYHDGYSSGPDYNYSGSTPASCLLPSTAILICLQMTLFRLPLISIDLYRTMTNPFLDFSHAVLQYDFVLYVYLIFVGSMFVILVEFVPGIGYSPPPHSSNANTEEYCPVLRSVDTDPSCYGMAGGWTFAVDESTTKPPKICFVPNVYSSTSTRATVTSLYSIIWLYFEIAASGLTTTTMTYFAYRRLVSGTSEVLNHSTKLSPKQFTLLVALYCQNF